MFELAYWFSILDASNSESEPDTARDEAADHSAALGIGTGAGVATVLA
jgi:hypothetical protein